MQSNNEIYNMLTEAGNTLYALFDGTERVSQWYLKKSSAMKAKQGTSYRIKTNKGRLG